MLELSLHDCLITNARVSHELTSVSLSYLTVLTASCRLPHVTQISGMTKTEVCSQKSISYITQEDLMNLTG